MIFSRDKRLRERGKQIEPLDFFGGGACPVQYEITYKEDYYYIRYRSSVLTIERNEERVFIAELNKTNDFDGDWSADDTAIYLGLISEAIRKQDFKRLNLPPRQDGTKKPKDPHQLSLGVRIVVILFLLALVGWLFVLLAVKSQRQQMIRSEVPVARLAGATQSPESSALNWPGRKGPKTNNMAANRTVTYRG